MHTETFSYLPQFSEEQIEKQVQYILDHNWIPGIEYSDTINPNDPYWHWWKLPLFGAEKVEEVMQELHACKEQNPDCYIRITGYDNKIQGQVLSFVAYNPKK